MVSMLIHKYKCSLKAVLGWRTTIALFITVCEFEDFVRWYLPLEYSYEMNCQLLAYLINTTHQGQWIYIIRELLRVVPEKDKLKQCLGIQVFNTSGETPRITTRTYYIDHQFTFVQKAIEQPQLWSIFRTNLLYHYHPFF